MKGITLRQRTEYLRKKRTCKECGMLYHPEVDHVCKKVK